MNTIKSISILFLCLALLAGCLIGCSQKPADEEIVPEPTPTPAPTPSPTPEPTPSPTPEVEKFFTVYDQEISSFDTELDFSNIPIEDGGAALEALIPELTHLEKVVMSDCGISNEDMDALNRRYEDIRFVWTVHFGAAYYLRTDETSFIASLFQGKQYYYSGLFDKDVECLKYCTDMVALDLGHMYFNHCDFCAYMPHLRYLILSDTPVVDISPLAGLQELWFLEVFNCNFTDVSPLLECPNLRHLNLCYDYIEDVEDLAKMEWLEKLRFVSPYLSYENRQMLEASLPNTHKELSGDTNSTGGTWRTDYAYFEMRDAFGVFYLK